MGKLTNDTDPGYCGIGNYETGEHDPFWHRLCRPHDKKFVKRFYERLSADANGWVTHREFFKTALVMGLESYFNLVMKPSWSEAYKAATWPFYFTLGGIGGMVRWRQLVNRENGGAPDYWNMIQ